MEQIDVLIGPVITEKSMDEAGSGRFTFMVAKEATKPQIKQAVENQFKVNVLSVQTLMVKGKRGRGGKQRRVIKKSPAKKAMVKLSPGQKIDLFEVPQEAPKPAEAKVKGKNEQKT